MKAFYKITTEAKTACLALATKVQVAGMTVEGLEAEAVQIDAEHWAIPLDDRTIQRLWELREGRETISDVLIKLMKLVDQGLSTKH